ncbi:hypothetical protein ABK040_001006 [Willaertia magna]
MTEDYSAIEDTTNQINKIYNDVIEGIENSKDSKDLELVCVSFEKFLEKYFLVPSSVLTKFSKENRNSEVLIKNLCENFHNILIQLGNKFKEYHPKDIDFPRFLFACYVFHYYWCSAYNELQLNNEELLDRFFITFEDEFEKLVIPYSENVLSDTKVPLNEVFKDFKWRTIRKTFTDPEDALLIDEIEKAIEEAVEDAKNYR